jgi:hypothetical protein
MTDTRRDRVSKDGASKDRASKDRASDDGAHAGGGHGHGHHDQPSHPAAASADSAPATDHQPKLVYLARRNPALSRQAFVDRWRRHGALGMSLPRWRNIARYVHCDVLEFPPATPGLDAGWDAVGMIWHRSPAARAAHLADTSSRATMERDEQETFAAPIVDTCMVAREHVCVGPPAQAARAARLVRVFDARLEVAQLGTESARLAELLHAAGVALRGHVVDLPLPPERGTRWGLDVGRIEEAWFDDVATAIRAAAVLAAAPVAPARLTLLTNEVLLYAA